MSTVYPTQTLRKGARMRSRTASRCSNTQTNACTYKCIHGIALICTHEGSDARALHALMVECSFVRKQACTDKGSPHNNLNSRAHLQGMYERTHAWLHVHLHSCKFVRTNAFTHNRLDTSLNSYASKHTKHLTYMRLNPNFHA